MTLEKAIKLLETKYEQSQKMEYVQKPLAWALFQVWKEADSTKADSTKDEKKREYNRIAQQKSRAKRKGGEG